jgi:hypothetical protein
MFDGDVKARWLQGLALLCILAMAALALFDAVKPTAQSAGQVSNVLAPCQQK